ALEMLATWDQMVMMPSEGAAARAHQLGALSRVAHERATDDDIGEWLAGLEDAQLDEVGRDIARLARRDWERSRRVPAELAAERSRASAAGQEAWRRARANDDFPGFAPALELNVQLARAYGECLAESAGDPYQALLADYDYGLTTEALRELFGELAATLPPLAEEARARSPRGDLAVPAAAQRTAVAGTLRRVGVDERSWRVDVSAHP